MQKVPTMFERDPGNLKRVLPTWQAECLWVRDGEGIATEKFDGSACLVLDGVLYKRHALKQGKPTPDGWVHWSLDHEQHSGHGWLPVVFGQPENAYHEEAWSYFDGEDGTYELVGPKLQKNPHRVARHELWKHGSVAFESDPRGFHSLGAWLADMPPMEGLVFHHPDGRMAKIKRRDFGLPWPA